MIDYTKLENKMHDTQTKKETEVRTQHIMVKAKIHTEVITNEYKGSTRQ